LPKEVVERLDHLLGAIPLAAAGEVDDVGEQHGDVREAIGDHASVWLRRVAIEAGRTLRSSRSDFSRSRSPGRARGGCALPRTNTNAAIVSPSR
jgi:hypothetical protein